MTSYSPNRFPKALSPNVITVGGQNINIRILEEHKYSVYNTEFDFTLYLNSVRQQEVNFNQFQVISTYSWYIPLILNDGSKYQGLTEHQGITEVNISLPPPSLSPLFCSVTFTLLFTIHHQLATPYSMLNTENCDTFPGLSAWTLPVVISALPFSVFWASCNSLKFASIWSPSQKSSSLALMFFRTSCTICKGPAQNENSESCF